MAEIIIPDVQYAAVLRNGYGEPHELDAKWPVPRPGPGEALIRLEAAGICAGDINPRDGLPPAPKIPRRPLITGHEGVGHIVSLGEKQEGLPEFALGDTVGMGWRRSTCRECKLCGSERENVCQGLKVNGYDGNGSHQEYVALPLSELIRIPSTSSKAKELAPLLCAGATALGGVRTTNLKAGEWLCIVGAAGGVGGLAVRYAKHFGYRVVAIDSRTKQSRCLDLGADIFVDYEDSESVVERVREATKEGANGVIVCSTSPVSYSQAIEYSAVGATIVSIGPAVVQFHTVQLMIKGIKFVGQSNGTRKDIEDALALSNVGVVPSVETVPLSSLDDALDALKQGKAIGRQVITFPVTGV